MLNTIVVALALLIFIGGVSIKLLGIKNKTPKSNKLSLLLVIISAFVFLFGASFTVIPTGYTGVKTTFGQISSRSLNNGFNFKVPFVQSIEIVNNKMSDVTFNSSVNAETSERTFISYNGVVVTYQINAEKSAWIYANVSNYKENLITQSLVSSAVKSSSKTLNDTNATNRSIIEPLIKTNIQKSLDEKYGTGVLDIVKVVVTSADFEDSYNSAIAAKQAAQLAAEKQEIENKKNIDKAKADAEVQITVANATAQANKIVNESLSENIILKQMLDKWNGEMPKVTGSSNSIFDVSSLIK